MKVKIERRDYHGKDEIIEVNSLKDINWDNLVKECKSYYDNGPGAIIGIIPNGKKENNSIDYFVCWGEYLD